VFNDADNTDTQCTITGLYNSTLYYIWVRPVNPGTIGPLSDDEDGTPYPAAGERRTYTAAGISFDMIFVPGLTFPTGLNSTEEATVDHDYWMADTEITNELIAAVLQWAYDDGRFNTTDDTAPNYLSSETVNFRGRQLIDLDYNDTDVFIKWNNSSFTIDSNKEYYPSICISWYGAIMICTWLSEILLDDDIVYTWTDNGNGTGIEDDNIWQDDETIADNSKLGFRIPENTEWELAARYLGTEAPTDEPLADEVLTTVNNGTTYYWTPGTYASGATDDYTNEDVSNLVSWNRHNSYDLSSAHVDYGPHIVGTSNISMVDHTPPPEPKSSLYPNALGIFDMSGNVLEQCFTELDDERYALGGNWGLSVIQTICIGNKISRHPTYCMPGLGFRLVMNE